MGDKLARGRFLLRNDLVNARSLPKERVRQSADFQALPRCRVDWVGTCVVHVCARVTESGQSAWLLRCIRLQPAECVACADAHGGCAGEQRLVEKGLDGAAQRGVAARQQAQAFDCGAADDVAFVLRELPQDFSGETDLLRRAGRAGGDQTEMPAGA